MNTTHPASRMRKASLLPLLFLLTMAAAAAARAQTDVYFDIPYPIPGEQQIRADRMKACVGQARPLVITFKPASDVTAYGTYAISSDNPAIATGSGNGGVAGAGPGASVNATATVRGVSPGIATIRVVWTVTGAQYTSTIQVEVECCKLEIQCVNVKICPRGSPPPALTKGGCPPIDIKGVRSDGKPLTDPYPDDKPVTIAWTATDRDGRHAACNQQVTAVKIPGPWYKDSSLIADVKIPDSLISKLQSGIDKIPGLRKIKLTEGRAGVVGRMRDCCDPKTLKLIPGGIKEAAGQGSLRAELKDIRIWPTPPIPIALNVDVGFASAEMELKFGLYFDANLYFAGEIGKRVDACGVDNCIFAEFNSSLDLRFKAQAGGSGCVSAFWSPKFCTEVTIMPAAVATQLKFEATYNKPDCSSGLDAHLTLGRIVFQAELVLGPIRFNYEYEIWGGKQIF